MRHLEDFQFIVNVFREEVPLDNNSDGTYLCSTTLRRELLVAPRGRGVTDDEAETARQLAFDVSFIWQSRGAEDQRYARSIENVVIFGSGRAAPRPPRWLAPRAPTWRRCSSRESSRRATDDQRSRVDNYPGVPEGIMGSDLMENMKKQVQRFGARIEQEPKHVGRSLDVAVPVLRTTSDEGMARTIIIARTGARARGTSGSRTRSGSRATV